MGWTSAQAPPAPHALRHLVWRWRHPGLDEGQSWGRRRNSSSRGRGRRPPRASCLRLHQAIKHLQLLQTQPPPCQRSGPHTTSYLRLPLFQCQTLWKKRPGLTESSSRRCLAVGLRGGVLIRALQMAVLGASQCWTLRKVLPGGYQGANQIHLGLPLRSRFQVLRPARHMEAAQEQAKSRLWFWKMMMKKWLAKGTNRGSHQGMTGGRRVVIIMVLQETMQGRDRSQESMWWMTGCMHSAAAMQI
mmetsp:Transcript_27425/g.74193  ORF Transcript_27425/g.74193 Transcript_27425/m.74193 type:complete len:245 (+) Transcript_27425:2214-2948(+)